MKSRKRIVLLALPFSLAVVMASLISGSSFLPNTNKTLAATPVEPVQASCNAVTVTNIQTQSVALGQAEKITVDWSFTPPAGDPGCAKVANFEVSIEVTRRSGRKNNRKIDASSSSRSVNAQFTEAGIGNLSDSIKSVKAVVTANLVAATGEKVLSGL